MKFNTYHIVDEIGNARVLESKRIDWPSKDLLMMEAVDLDSYRSALAEDMNDRSVPLQPENVNPLVPVDFQYRTRPDGEVKSVHGIVMADEVGSLVRFAEQNLVHVDHHPALNGFLETKRDAFRPREERRSRLMTALNKIPNERNEPYRASPLVYRPLEAWNGSNTVGRKNETYEMHMRTRDDSEFLFVSRHCLEYFSPRNLNTNNRQFDEQSGKRQMTIRYDPLVYRPCFFTGIGDETEDASKDPGFDHVIGISNRSNEEIQWYSWSCSDDRGVVSDPRNLPLSLLESLDEAGSQVHRPDNIGSPIPMTFMDPKWTFQVNSSELNQALSETIEDDELNHPLKNDGHLDRCWYVNDRRMRLTSSATDKKSHSDSSDDTVRTVEDPTALAYILQRTKDGLYDPDHRAQSTTVEDLGMSTLSFSLDEV